MLRIPFALLLVALAPFLARAGGDEVVVVYNRSLPESKTVAMDYARLRHVPEKQIFGFSLTTNEIMSRKDFHDSLQVPLAQKLASSGLWKFGAVVLPGPSGALPQAIECVVASKIRYAVLCYGVPLKIANDPTISEPEDSSIPDLFKENSASVDSELAWLPLIKNPQQRLSGPLKNWVYGTTNAAALDPTNGILLVTRLDGPTVDVALGLVQKSLQAEQDGLWGRAYFDARGITNTMFKLGDDWILASAELCSRLGYETVVDDRPETFPADFPMSQIALYAGWYTEDADGPFAQPTVEFMPGAFAYHLHSFSAATLRSPVKNWCGPLLAKGVTCTMGCVNEPSIQFTPNVAIFLARWTLGQFTFGEAAWAAQPALSWQTAVIGDPLYRPFGEEPKQLAADLERTHSPLVEWAYLRAVNGALVQGVSPAESESYLENLPETQTSSVLTEKLAELCDAQGKPESAVDYYQRALKLKPSPEQRIRLRLELAREFLKQKNTAAAVQDYKQLLAESPDYPGKDSVNERLMSLEQKVTRTR